MVAVAQWLERRSVAAEVVGSSPISHPMMNNQLKVKPQIPLIASLPHQTDLERLGNSLIHLDSPT